MAKSHWFKRYLIKFIYFLNHKFFVIYGLILFYRECLKASTGVRKGIHFYLKKQRSLL